LPPAEVLAKDNRQKLYEHVKRAFSDNATVDVILDRRNAESRNVNRANAPDRRRGDHRLRLDIDDHLKALGWAIVRLNVFRTAGPAHASKSR